MFVLDFDGNLLLDTRITFGGVAGCGSFGRPADAWKQIMMAEFDLVTVFQWVDNNLFIRKKGSKTEMDAIAARAIELGVLTIATKYKPFKDKQKLIGFIWNGANKTVRLPDDKLTERIAQINECLQPGTAFSFNDIEILVGRLNHVSYVVPQLKCYLCGLYRMLKSWVNGSATRCIDNATLEDLKRWHLTLTTFEPMRMIPSRNPTDVGCYRDTSTSFGIGILINGKWGQFRWTGAGKGLVDKGILAWLETVAIRLGVLMLIQMGATRGKRFLVYTDSTTTEGAIRNRKSNDKRVNEEWKKNSASVG
jgi:hypothetical protein